MIAGAGGQLRIKGTSPSGFGCLLCLAFGVAYLAVGGPALRYLRAHGWGHLHLPAGLIIGLYYVAGFCLLIVLLGLTSRIRRTAIITADSVRLSVGRYGVAALNGVTWQAGPWTDPSGRRGRGSALSLDINGRPVRVGARNHELPSAERGGPVATTVQIEVNPADFDRLHAALRTVTPSGAPGTGPIDGVAASARLAMPAWPVSLYEPPVTYKLTPLRVQLGFITAFALLIVSFLGAIRAPAGLQRPLFLAGATLAVALGFGSCVALMRLQLRSRNQQDPMTPTWTLTARDGVVTVRDSNGSVVAVDRAIWQPRHYLQAHKSGTDVFPAMILTVSPLRPLSIAVNPSMGYFMRPAGQYVHPLCWPGQTAPIGGRLLRVSDADWQILVEGLGQSS